MIDFRFVHAADLHLDSPFAGAGNEAPAHVVDALRDATFGAYEAIISLCLQERVDALLIAGDIYDGADRSLRAQLQFLSGLRRLSEAGIRSFVCHGNHDPLSGWESKETWPAGCHRFGPSVECVPFDPREPGRVHVYGYSYPQQRVTENIARRFRRSGDAAFAVGLLHCNAGGDPRHEPYAPCSLDDLASAGMDYWALGHVHTRAVLRENGPAIVYPGNPQGRHANETGERGVYLVEAHGPGGIQLRFEPVDRVRWETIRVGINELEADDLPGLQERIERALAAAFDAAGGRPLVYRLELTGRGPLHRTLRRGATVDDIRGRANDEWAAGQQFAWCERITDHTTPPFDRELALSSDDFVGELVRRADAASAAADFDGFWRALDPLLAHGRARTYLRDAPRSDEALRKLLSGAETACLDELLEASEP